MNEKINWNQARDEWAEKMEPVIIWDKGTDAQQEFADAIISSFCKRIAKYLCWACKGETITMDEADAIVTELELAMNDRDDARWWCNRKNKDDIKIALDLADDIDVRDNLKKIEKNHL